MAQMIRRLLPLEVLTVFMAQAAQSGEMMWLQALERLGSFGLVAFLVWYFVKYALPLQRQDYIAAENKGVEGYIVAQQEARTQYLASVVQQRADFMEMLTNTRLDASEARKLDREVLKEMAGAVSTLANATSRHVNRAEEVWKIQGLKSAVDHSELMKKVIDGS